MTERYTPRLVTDDAILTPRGAAPTTSPPAASRPLDQDDFAYETEQSVSSHIVPPTTAFTGWRPEVLPVRDVCSQVYGRFSFQTNETDIDWRKSPSRSPVVEQDIVKQTPTDTMARKTSVSPSPSTLPSLETSLNSLKLNSSFTQRQTKDVVDSEPETKVQAIAESYCRQDDDGDTLLHFLLIIHSMKVATITALIDRAPTPQCLDVRNFHGLTPMHIAIYNNQPEIVARLLNAGASLEPVDALYGDTPALMACRLGHGACLSEIVKAIKQRVSKMCCSNGWRNVEDRTADELRKVLQSRDKEGLSCLQLASKLPDLAIFYNLIYGYNVDINQIELRRGMTLLHYAAYCNNLELVQVLVGLPDIDVFRLTYDYKTALQLALDRKHADVAAILRRHMSYYVEEIDDKDMSSDSEMETDYEA